MSVAVVPAASIVPLGQNMRGGVVDHYLPAFVPLFDAAPTAACVEHLSGGHEVRAYYLAGVCEFGNALMKTMARFVALAVQSSANLGRGS